MPYGWRCDGCGSIFDSLPKRTRIVVSVYPTQSFWVDRTYCSLDCVLLEEDEIRSEEAWAEERRQAAVRNGGRG